MPSSHPWQIHDEVKRMNNNPVLTFGLYSFPHFLRSLYWSCPINTILRFVSPTVILPSISLQQQSCTQFAVYSYRGFIAVCFICITQSFSPENHYFGACLCLVHSLPFDVYLFPNQDEQIGADWMIPRKFFYLYGPSNGVHHLRLITYCRMKNWTTSN